MIKRLLFGGLSIGLVAGLVYVDAHYLARIPTIVAISGLGLLAQWEVYQICRKIGWQSEPLLGLLIGAFLFLAVAGFDLIKGFVLALGVIFVFAVEVFRGRIDLQRITTTLFGILLVPLGLSFVISIRSRVNGLEEVLFLVAVAKTGDVFAYFSGLAIGRHKLSPSISPAKTWEGSIASLLSSLGIALLFYDQKWLHGLSLGNVLVLGAGINVAGQIADLSKSILKRACGVKDSGTYFSVMGGALDMIDSLIFAAPTYLALKMVMALTNG